MKKVKYRIYWGSSDFFYKTRQDFLSEFILDIFYLMEDFGIVPPLIVLNEVLQEGGSSGGMSPGTKWKPFKITEAEYTELISNLLVADVATLKKKHPFVTFQNLAVDEELSQLSDYSGWREAVFTKYGKK